MAVRKGDQSEGKITAVDASRELISYTYDRVHDKTLPKADRWLMSKSIWDACSKARRHIVVGNSIKVENAEEARERILRLKIAIGYLDDLASLIDALHIKEKISDDRCDFWAGLVTKTQNATKGMLKANKRQYAPFLSEQEK